MDWKNVILTLGIALISSIVPIIGNIINNKHNHKMIIERNKEEVVKEVMSKRIECYKQILVCLSLIDGNLANKDAIKNSNIVEFYVDYEVYISKFVYHLLGRLIKRFDVNKPNEMHFNILNLKEVIKKEINVYLGVPNSIHDKNYPKS